jgi:hypothetical protein
LVGGYRCPPIQQVTKSRDLGTQRMQSPLWLIQLLWIAKQDDTGRGWRERKHVRQSHLTRLIHEKHIHRVRHVLASPHPRRSRRDLCRPRGQGAEDTVAVLCNHRRMLTMASFTRFLHCLERNTIFGSCASHFIKQIAHNLVADGGYLRDA